MTKKTPKALSEYFSKIGKAGYRAKKKKILELAKRQIKAENKNQTKNGNKL